MTIHVPSGVHILIDGEHCDEQLLDNATALLALLRRAVEMAGATVLCDMVHRFEPQGVTLALVLSESHATIHTYPEHGRYMADIFTCGDVDALRGARWFCEQVGGTASIKIAPRGIAQRSGRQLDD